MKKILICLLFCSLNLHALTPSTPAEHTDFNAVVFLKIPAMDSSGSVTGYCNGTLISNRVLITAAHCLAGSTVKHGDRIEIEIGQYKYRETTDGKIIRVGYITTKKIQTDVQVHFQPGIGFDSTANRIPPEKDFAFVVLNSPIDLPNDFVFPKVWNQRFSGFNITNPFVVTINPLEYVTSNDTKQFAYLNQFINKGYSAESKSTSRVAPGDSGAPVFASINNEVYLVGVTKGRAETFFSNWDVFALWSDRVPSL